MSNYFRAVAIDYDGTLTLDRRPSDSILASIGRFRATHRYVVLVTGRIYRELLVDFPEAAQHFDAIVTENGAAIWRGGRERPLAPAVAPILEERLVAAGVRLRRGTVILALDAIHDAQVRRACIELGLDAQLIRNRGALMVVPSGVSKATGLHEALAELGLSYHNTVGFGDAENDLALLQATEIGVAVGNAVPSLKAAADHVLDGNNGDALGNFIEQRVQQGLRDLQLPRRSVTLGITEKGENVTIPASRVHVFIDGPTGSGKSYIAGLLVEAWVAAGYTLCVLDLEGDHGALGDDLRGVLSLGGAEPLPAVEEVGRLIRNRFSSVILDLSLREPAVKSAYARDVLAHLSAIRSSYGLPHWMVVEEAHMLPTEALDQARAAGNVCLVTYHPDWLPASGVETFDVLITAESIGQARIVTGGARKEAIRFHPGVREVAHVRHLHKYAEGKVTYERGFTFRAGDGSLGLHITSLASLRQALVDAPAGTLLHHAAHRDFSRWVQDVFRDRTLASSLRRLEERCHPQAVDEFRVAAREVIALRYNLDGDP